MRYCYFTNTPIAVPLEPVECIEYLRRSKRLHTHDDTSPTSEPRSATNTITSFVTHLFISLVTLCRSHNSCACVCVHICSFNFLWPNKTNTGQPYIQLLLATVVCAYARQNRHRRKFLRFHRFDTRSTYQSIDIISTGKTKSRLVRCACVTIYSNFCSN